MGVAVVLLVMALLVAATVVPAVLISRRVRVGVVQYDRGAVHLSRTPRASAAHGADLELVLRVQQLAGARRPGAAMNVVLDALRRDPRSETAYRCALTVGHAGRSDDQLEPVTIEQLRDPRLDPISTVCSWCGARWLSTDEVLHGRGQMSITDPDGLQCQTCRLTLCRDCVTDDRACPQERCPGRLGTPVLATGPPPAGTESSGQRIASERREQELPAMLTRFRAELEPAGSVADGDEPFMRKATQQLPRSELPADWEAMADRLGPLASDGLAAANRSARAGTLPAMGAHPRSDRVRLPETDRLIEFGKEIGETGGGWLMVLIAHRARIKYRTDVRFVELAWDGFYGWQE